MKHYSHVTRYHAFPDSAGAWGRQIASRSSLRSRLLSTGRQRLTSLKQDGLKPNKRLHKIDFPSCCLLSLSCSLFFLLRLSRNWVERNVQPRGEWGSEEQCPRSSSRRCHSKEKRLGLRPVCQSFETLRAKPIRQRYRQLKFSTKLRFCLRHCVCTFRGMSEWKK